MAGLFGFLRSFGKEKLGQAGQSITQRIVSWDPETASQAEIEEMIAELDKITVEAGKAKAEYDREQAEADAAHKNYDRYMAAAELLNKQLDEAKGAGDEPKAQQLGTSLEKLLSDLEKLSPEVDREAREAEEAKAYYQEVKELAELTAQKVKSARSQLDGAQRDMRRAEIEKERAKSRAEKAENLAGLRKDTSSLGVALAAMNKQAEDAKASASASDMKAQLLAPTRDKEDENIKAALNAVSGESSTATGSVSDRLAALRKK
jgi:chromosome segregation ATPase